MPGCYVRETQRVLVGFRRSTPTTPYSAAGALDRGSSEFAAVARGRRSQNSDGMATDRSILENPTEGGEMPGKARLSLITSITAVMLATAGCGGSTTPNDSESAPSATTSAQADAPAGGKVSANTASVEDIAAALDAAGVTNAERWAHEVEEYRPYPPDDPNLQKLRDNLAKYNPGDETVNKIVSALTP
jgi:hypothetical protein